MYYELFWLISSHWLWAKYVYVIVYCCCFISRFCVCVIPFLCRNLKFTIFIFWKMSLSFLMLKSPGIINDVSSLAESSSTSQLFLTEYFLRIHQAMKRISCTNGWVLQKSTFISTLLISFIVGRIFVVIMILFKFNQ